MSIKHVKPDLEIATKHIDKDHALMLVLCISIIILSIVAWFLDWSYQPVFFVMAFIAFLFLGQKKDIPDSSWSPQQKGSWTKRCTTIKVKDGQLVYVSGDGPNDIDNYALSTIQRLDLNNNKLIIQFKDGTSKKVSAKYWANDDIQGFVNATNSQLQENS